MNGYNNAVVDQYSWEGAIQPKAKIIMSMLLEQPLKGSKCPLPSCNGVILLDKKNISGNW
jgi:hypothetical protein